MSANEMTFDKLPEAVNTLIQKVDHLTSLLLEKGKEPKEKTNDFIDINEAAKLLHKSKATIYALVSKSAIPHYKNGQKLFFSEKELLDYIRAGKKYSTAELINEASKSINELPPRRPSKY